MRDPTRSDHPKGAEAQCVRCWRIFTRDSVCEDHKRYTSRGVECQDPVQLGFQARERRGMVVWSGPPPSGPHFFSTRRIRGNEDHAAPAEATP